MKTLVVHKNGEVIFTMQNLDIEGKYDCLVTEIESNKEIIAVDVVTNTVITKDKDTRVSDIQEYLNNADDTTISKVEDTILEVESNKITKEG